MSNTFIIKYGNDIFYDSLKLIAEDLKYIKFTLHDIDELNSLKKKIFNISSANYSIKYRLSRIFNLTEFSLNFDIVYGDTTYFIPSFDCIKEVIDHSNIKEWNRTRKNIKQKPEDFIKLDYKFYKQMIDDAVDDIEFKIASENYRLSYSILQLLIQIINELIEMKLI